MIVNLGAVKRAHARLVDETSRAVLTHLDRAGAIAADHVRQNAPTRSGKLRESTRHRVVRMAKGGRVIIRNRAKHAAAQEHGAGPHVIRPKRAKVLSFMWRGERVFFTRVNHPGNPPTRFLWKATQAAYVATGATLEVAIRRIAARF